ncbi:MAG: DUF72 domain-containing protein [Acidobacteria bacterium]|nr:DUF72 domain-containing protein [Acidobacteriota bacterium]
MNPSLHLGPAGWTRPEWARQVFGRTGTRGWHPLDILSRYTNLAEIDRTYHEPLKPEIARLYAAKVERREDFIFTAIAGRRFTHDRDLDESAVEAWCAGFRPLHHAGRLGALILQFPWAFRFNEENRQHLIRLRRAFHEFPLAAEMRHDSWLLEEAVTTLVDYRIAIVNVDQPAYFRAMPSGAHLTSSIAIVRLHGRADSAAFLDFEAEPDHGYLYNLDELLEWKPRLERLSANARRTLVVTTNAAQGRSLVNALQLKEILGERQLEAPEALIAAYPAELAAFRAQHPVQQQLLPALAA